MKAPKEIKKNSCVFEKRKMLYKTRIHKNHFDNLIIDEKLSSSHCSENTDSNATRITSSNAVN